MMHRFLSTAREVHAPGPTGRSTDGGPADLLPARSAAVRRCADDVPRPVRPAQAAVAHRRLVLARADREGRAQAVARAPAVLARLVAAGRPAGALHLQPR